MTPARTVGVYVLGNDAVYRWLSAFVGSFRRSNPETPLCLIPFDENSDRCTDLVSDAAGTVLRNDEAFGRLEAIGAALELGRSPTGRRWFRRFAAFDGPFDAFAYFDCRMVVLGDVRPFAESSLTHAVPLVHYDVAINQVYEDGDLRRRFCTDGLGHGFLSGMWASRRGLFSLEDMERSGRELVGVRSQMNPRNTDQFFLNYLCDSRGLKVCHFADLDSRLARSAWALGSGHIYLDSDGSWRRWDFGGVDHRRVLPFVHWGGIRLDPSMPGYFLHRRFRKYRVRWGEAFAETLRRPIGLLGRAIRGQRNLNQWYHHLRGHVVP